MDRLAKIFQVSLAPNQAFSRHTAYTSPRNPITLNWNHEFYILAIPNEDNDPCPFYSLTFVRSSMNLSIELRVSLDKYLFKFHRELDNLLYLLVSMTTV